MRIVEAQPAAPTTVLKSGRSRLRLYAFLFSIAAALPVHAQDQATLRRASALIRKVPPRATMARLKPLLPKGTRLGARGVVTQGAGKTWIVQPFSGPLNGQFNFFNGRRAAKRQPGMPPPPPFDAANKLLLPQDQIHSVEIILGPPIRNKGKGALTSETRCYVDALAKQLGKPKYLRNSGESGGPDASGWRAQWILPGGRRVDFIDSFPLLGSVERPLLQVYWNYSQIYAS